MAWELTWPLALIDLAMVFLIHGVIGAEGETLDSVWALAAFFVVSPWVVRRAAAQRVEVVRGGAVHAALTYQESLKVMWLLAWRALLLSLAALLGVSLLLRLAGETSLRFSTDDPLINAVGLSLVDTVSSLALYPFLIPGMLRKKYRGFSLRLSPAQAPGPSPAANPRR